MTQQESLSQAMANLEEEKAKNLVKEKIEAKVPAIKILKELQTGMIEVGNRYQRDEYFVAELVYAGEIMKEITADLEPLLEGAPESETTVGKVVIGTVKGDIHDVGKDIVVIMLRGAGFDVIDLGVDVPPQKFVEAIKESGAPVVGMSVFLTMAYEAAAETVNAIKEAGLRDKVSIMIGGGPVTELVREKTGCDFYGKDAAAGVNYALKVVGSKKAA
ncbi:TPA: cobalamin-binding protein [Candidatus Poribacteria bacterium]|nr:cobalamin-binding protein [Candidatus Poribacteria bacterium]